MNKMILGADKFIIIGGAEDKKNKMEILKYVASKLKGDNTLLIATVASEEPNEIIKEYTKIFKSLSVKNIKELSINKRDECFHLEKISLIKEADIIFFTGGDQLRITSILGGTPIYKILKEQIINKCIYVGTSAGASVVSETMVVCGEDDESPCKCYVNMSKGFGFLKNVIIDQHFAQRGRIGRLLAMVSQNPENIGIGIDEDTAIVVDSNKVMKVIGSGAVYIVDGRSITYSNISELGKKEVLSIYNIKLHILASGKKFNLITKEPFEEEV